MKTIFASFLALILIAFNINAAPSAVERVTQVAKEEAVKATGISNGASALAVAKQAGSKAYDEAKTGITNALASETVKVAKTNLNSVMIDILSGVRDAGKEVYGASRDAIRASVNFASEQAPLVVKEFLMWHLARASIYALGFLSVGIALWWTARFIRKNVLPKTNDKAGTWAGISALRVVGAALILFGVGSNAMTVTKIAIAPKVYIIEYVVDTIQGDHRTADTR